MQHRQLPSFRGRHQVFRKYRMTALGREILLPTRRTKDGDISLRRKLPQPRDHAGAARNDGGSMYGGL